MADYHSCQFNYWIGIHVRSKTSQTNGITAKKFQLLKLKIECILKYETTAAVGM